MGIGAGGPQPFLRSFFGGRFQRGTPDTPGRRPPTLLVQSGPIEFSAMWIERPFEAGATVCGYEPAGRPGTILSDRHLPVRWKCAGIRVVPILDRVTSTDLLAHFEPGRMVGLDVETGSAQDLSVVARSNDGLFTLGRLPPVAARHVAHRLELGQLFRGVVLGELVDAGGHRSGISLLLGPALEARRCFDD